MCAWRDSPVHHIFWRTCPPCFLAETRNRRFRSRDRGASPFPTIPPLRKQNLRWGSTLPHTPSGRGICFPLHLLSYLLMYSLVSWRRRVLPPRPRFRSRDRGASPFPTIPPLRKQNLRWGNSFPHTPLVALVSPLSKFSISHFSFLYFFCAPGATRTRNHWIRSPPLYPIELQAPFKIIPYPYHFVLWNVILRRDRELKVFFKNFKITLLQSTI